MTLGLFCPLPRCRRVPQPCITMKMIITTPAHRNLQSQHHAPRLRLLAWASEQQASGNPDEWHVSGSTGGQQEQIKDGVWTPIQKKTYIYTKKWRMVQTRH